MGRPRYCLDIAALQKLLTTATSGLVLSCRNIPPLMSMCGMMWSCRILFPYLMPVSAPATCTKAILPPWWICAHTMMLPLPKQLTYCMQFGENKTHLITEQSILTFFWHHCRWLLNDVRWKCYTTLVFHRTSWCICFSERDVFVFQYDHWLWLHLCKLDVFSSVLASPFTHLLHYLYDVFHSVNIIW